MQKYSVIQHLIENILSLLCIGEIAIREIVWEFIEGSQPAPNWLKDHKGCKLEHEDILYDQKIIVALSETDRLMKEIDKIDI
jgi:hypothetical protein